MANGKFCFSFATLALAAVAWSSPPSPAFLWLNSNILRHITLSGERRIGFHAVSVSGDKNAYDSLTNFGQGNKTITDVGQMSVIGQKVLGVFNFDFQFDDNHYQDPLNSRFSLDYVHHGVSVDAGDIRGSLYTQNRFLSFSRELWGLQMGVNRGRTDLHIIHSNSRSSAQTISFNGNNSSGPYYLQNSEIVPDSVQVQVNGQTMKYPNDFTVDSVAGTITFTNLSVPPTSTIVVSFESLSQNTGSGAIDGVSGDYNLGKFGLLGITAVRQTDPNANSLGVIVDRYEGYGDPTTPYTLSYIPLQSAPIIVKVDGIIQAPNVDYYFSTTDPSLVYFRRAIPQTSEVDISYTPQPTTTLNGDRTEYGLLYRLNFGKLGRDGNILYSNAYSHLSNSITPLNGFAQGISGVYNYKHYKLTASFDNIPSSFVGVESTGFLRNEVASKMGIDYQYKSLQYGVTASNSAVALRNVSSTGQISFTDTRTTQDTGYVSFVTPDQSQWILNQTHETSNSPDGNSRADISSLNYTKMFGKLNLTMGLNRTSGYGPISNGLTSTNGSVLTNSISLKPSYVAAKGLVLSANTAISSINAGGTSGTGTDLALNANFSSKNNAFKFQSSYHVSNSGQLATLGGFSNGFGAGYNGNGFTGGVYSGGGLNNSFNTAGTNIRDWTNTASYSVNQRLSTSMNFGTTMESGGISSNSQSTSYGMSANYDLRNNQYCSLAFIQSNTSFLGGTGASDATSLTFFVNGSPKGPWSYLAGLSVLLSTGGQFAQNSISWQGSLRNHVHRNQAFLIDFQVGNVTNYQPQSNTQFSLGYEYQLLKNLAIIGRYSIRNVVNLDPTITTGAYSSHGFSLNFDFRY